MLNKPYNDGDWTAARFHSFIKSALRAASVRWPPKNKVKRNARVGYGLYMCAGYHADPHVVNASLPPKPGNSKRIDNAVVDHICPVVDPGNGFQSWDVLIERLFCDSSNLQVLCHECHARKTKDEQEVRQ